MLIKLSVADQMDWPGLGHHGRGLVQQLGLVVCVKGSRIRHIVQNIAAYQAIPNCKQNSREFARQIANNAQQKKVLAKERLVTHLSATASSLSGLKVPSVSMYMALPSPPPWSIGSCRTTKTL